MTLLLAKRIIALLVVFIFYGVGMPTSFGQPNIGSKIPVTGGKYEVREIEGKRDNWYDLEIQTQDHRQKIIIPSIYEFSCGAVCAAFSPGGRSLFLSGTICGSGRPWLARYDLVKKKRVAVLDSLIPRKAMIPVCIQWNDKLKILQLEDGDEQIFPLKGLHY